MKATPFNQKTIDEFHAKQGRGVGVFGDHVLLMTAKGARSGEAITTPRTSRPLRPSARTTVVTRCGGTSGAAPLNPAAINPIDTSLKQNRIILFKQNKPAYHYIAIRRHTRESMA